MNKLLILTLLLFIFSMKINAYEYLVYYYSPYNRIRIFTDKNGVLQYQQIENGVVNSTANVDSTHFWNTISSVHRNQTNFVNKNKFDEYYKNDLIFLNDLYTQSLQQFLNYLYNPDSFSKTSHIVYEDYQLLYNSDGLAVESIVNGSWAGAYPQYESGELFNKSGDLLYNNGVEVSFIEKLGNKIFKPLKKSVQSSFGLKIWYSLLAVIFVIAMLRFIIRQAFKAFLIKFYTRQMDRLQKRREKIENA